MAEITLNEGTKSLNAAGWSDATGFANDTDMAIIDSHQTHTDLDRTADTTTGIQYIHIRGGIPYFGPGQGNLKIEFKAAYTTRPQFIWNTMGGVCYLEFATLAANKIELLGAGEVRLFQSGSGSVATISIGGNVSCFIDAALDVVSKITVTDNASLKIQHKAGDNIPILHANGNARVRSERRIVTLNVADTAEVWQENETGSSTTTLTLTGGVYHPVRGDVATVDWHGGLIDQSAAKYSLTLGSTAFNMHSNRLRQPSGTDLVIIANIDRGLDTGGPA